MPSPRSNYLRTTNPFSLVPPPNWWLDEMRAFDDQLVIFPSAENAHFRLARKMTKTSALLSAHLPQVKDFSPSPDTITMSAFHLVPVTTVLSGPGGMWTSYTFIELAERDVWRHGGADKVADRLEAREAAQRAKDRDNAIGEVDQMAHAMYHSYSRRTGSRVSNSGTAAKQLVTL